MALQGVTFINIDTGKEIHTLRDWGLYLHGKPVIGVPEPKYLTVDVPGMNGVINYTKQFLGRVSYNSRPLTVELMAIDNRDKWDSINSDIYDALTGQHLKIILDSDPDYFYEGFSSQGGVSYEKFRNIISIKFNVDPYKLEMKSSLEPWIWDTFNFEDGIIREYKDLTVNGTLTLVIPARRMEVVPEFIVEGAGSQGLQLQYNGNTYTLRNGSNIIPAIDLPEGENELVFTGNGRVSVDYRGGRL